MRTLVKKFYLSECKREIEIENFHGNLVFWSQMPTSEWIVSEHLFCYNCARYWQQLDMENGAKCFWLWVNIAYYPIHCSKSIYDRNHVIATGITDTSLGVKTLSSKQTVIIVCISKNELQNIL